MQMPDILEQIYKGRFFKQLEEAIRDACAEEFLPWLDLLTTEAIEDWAYSSPSLKKVRSGRWAHGQPVLALLLKRRLLHLGTRRDPSRLRSFSDWAGLSHLNRIWACLPEALEPLSVMAQEKRFTEHIYTAAEEAKAKKGPKHWATRELSRLADSRKETAEVPTARVVFAATYRPVDDIRPGVLVDFHLQGPAENNIVLANREFFDDAFLDALDHIGSRIGELQRRHVGHNCKIPLRGLSGASGAMALWIAHRLASPGLQFEGRPRALPPWIVISSELDMPRPHAPAPPVEFCNEKAAVLEEEGVRQFWIPEGSSLPVRVIEDLQVRTFTKGGFELAKRLFEEEQLLRGDFSAYETQLITQPPDARERDERRRERQRARNSEDALRLPPTYAFQRIADGLSRLPEKGLLLVQGPSGHGKSEIVGSLARGEHLQGPFRQLGKAIAFHVLRGEATHPKYFLDFIARRAEQLDESGVLGIERAKGDPHVPLVRRRIQQLLADTKNTVCPDEPLLLILDGIDELDEQSAPVLLDLLPRADKLPSGCFAVLVSQNEVPAHVEKSVKKITIEAGPDLVHHLDFTADDPEYQSLLRDYAVASLGDECESILPRMLSATTSFRYFSLLCRWLELLRDRGVHWASLEPSDFPQADEIFIRYLSELRESTGPSHFDEWERRVLIMIGAGYEPIDRECLAYWLRGLSKDSVDVDHEIDLAIDRLRPLLRVERRLWLGNRTQFVLNDANFKEWLLTNDDPYWGEEVYVECLSRIIKAGRRMFSRGGELAKLRDTKAIQLLHYHFCYLPTMMLEIGDYSSAYRFLTQPWQDDFFESFMRLWGTPLYGSQQLTLCARRTLDFVELEKRVSEDDSYPLECWAACARGAGTSMLKMVGAFVRMGRLEDADQKLSALMQMLGMDAFLDGRMTDTFRTLASQDTLEDRLKFIHLVAETFLAAAEIDLANQDEDKAYRQLSHAFEVMKMSMGVERKGYGDDLIPILTIWSKVSRLLTELSPTTDRWIHSAKCSSLLLQAIQGVIREEGGLETASKVDDRLGPLLAQAMHDRARTLLAYSQMQPEMLQEFSPDQLSALFASPEEISNPIPNAISLCNRALELTSSSIMDSATKAQMLITRARCERIEGDWFGFRQDLRRAIELLKQAAMVDSISYLGDLLECYRECAVVLGPYADDENGLPILLEAIVVVGVILEKVREMPHPQGLRGGQRIVELTRWLDAAIHDSGLIRTIDADGIDKWRKTKKWIEEMAGLEM